MRLSKADFYHWAYSDLLVNVNRGRFAEYIVATALGVAQTVREEWDAYDLKFNDIKKLKVLLIFSVGISTEKYRKSHSVYAPHAVMMMWPCAITAIMHENLMYMCSVC